MIRIRRFSRVPHWIYLSVLGAVFAALWLALAVAPVDRHAWFMENVLVVGLVAILYLSRRKLPLSRVSYTLIFLFLCLHSIGAHFTYSQVPYDDWFRAITGRSLDAMMGWERNNYDRFVHFGYGFLLAYPVRELFFRVARVRGFWSYALPLDLTMSTSMLYELFEWWVVLLFGGDLGVAYLGTQGDPWDAHKDMSLAGLGAFIAMLVTLAINWWGQSDFQREWTESLRVQRWRPLGEDELRRRGRRRKWLRRRMADRADRRKPT